MRLRATQSLQNCVEFQGVEHGGTQFMKKMPQEGKLPPFGAAAGGWYGAGRVKERARPNMVR